MKSKILHLVCLFCLLVSISVSYGQEETRVSGTLKVYPWINMPIVLSSDMKGGLQSLGVLNLTATPVTVLNATVPAYNREKGMIASVIDADNGNQTRYFEYLGGDNWRDIYVINGWEPGRAYAIGDYVAYQKNYYIANTTFTSDATSFATDAANWNNAGGKDSKYSASQLTMDSKTLSKVAVTGTIVPVLDVDKTIVTVGFINGIVGGGGSAFDANKIITRTGLPGITGSNYNTATITDFLNKIFFPVLSPMATSFRYDVNNTAGQFSYQDENATTKVVTDHPGTVTVSYSVWNGLGANIAFNYAITKRDPSSSITKVELFKSGVSKGSIVDGALTGSFTLAKSDFINIDATQNIPLTLTVTDNASNVVSLILNTSFTQANGVTLSNTLISTTNSGPALTTPEGSGTSGDPYLIERTGSDLNKYFVWTINGNDDAGKVTNIYFSGTPTLISLTDATNIAQTSTAVLIPNSDATTIYRVGASAKGSVANDISAVSYSAYYQLQDRLYCGFLASNTPPSSGNITALPTSSLKTSTYSAANGVSLTNSTGGSGFFTWAIPTYVDGNSSAPTFSKTVYYYAMGQWFTNSNTTVHYVKVAEGSTSSWYWVCIYNASTANGGVMQAKFN